MYTKDLYSTLHFDYNKEKNKCKVVEKTKKKKKKKKLIKIFFNLN